MFYVRVFCLLNYLLATVNEHVSIGFDELLFVCPIPFDVANMGVPPGDLISCQDSSSGY